MTVGSLFTGIGGIDLGFQRAGFEIAWQVEIDDYCRRVLAKHWPDVRRHDDVTMFPPSDPSEWKVDVITGGFPCQDISYAGRGEGIQEGNRSGLWFEFHRIIRLVRPRFVFVENVAALLERGLGRVLGDLAGSGFDAEWDVWGADIFGSSQHRKRLWLLAYPNDSGLEGPVWAGKSNPARTGGGIFTLRTSAISLWILAARTSCARQHSANG